MRERTVTRSTPREEGLVDAGVERRGCSASLLLASRTTGACIAEARRTRLCCGASEVVGRAHVTGRVCVVRWCTLSAARAPAMASGNETLHSLCPVHHSSPPPSDGSGGPDRRSTGGSSDPCDGGELSRRVRVCAAVFATAGGAGGHSAFHRWHSRRRRVGEALSERLSALNTLYSLYV